MNTFKDEILKKIKELENKFFTHLSKKSLEINMNYEDFSEKVNLILESNRLMIESITNQKINFEKITKLESITNGINEKLITFDIRINNTINDIKKMKFNYDKIINDNIIIPAYIGPGTKYKSLGDFIINTINEFRIFKEEKEKLSISNIELKNKMDSMMKNMSNFVEFNSARCMAYTDTKEKELQTKLDSLIKQMDEKTLEGNQGIYVKQIKSEEKLKEITNELNKLLENKNYINNKFDKIEINEDEINEELKKVSNEVYELKIIKNDLREKIKNLYQKIQNMDKESKNKFVVQQNKTSQDIIPTKNSQFNSLGNIFYRSNNNINNTIEDKNKTKKNEFPNLSNIFNSATPKTTQNKEKEKMRLYRNEKKSSLNFFNSKTEEESKDNKNIIKNIENKNINENTLRKSNNNIIIKERKNSEKNKILKPDNFISPKIRSNNKITIKEKIYQTSTNNLNLNSYLPKNKNILITETNENSKTKNNDIIEIKKKSKNLKMLDYKDERFGKTKIEFIKILNNNKKEEIKPKIKFSKKYQNNITQTSSNIHNKEIDIENLLCSNDNKNIIECNLINLNMMDLPEYKNSIISSGQDLKQNSFDSNYNERKSYKIDSKNKTVSSNFSKTTNAFYTNKEN